jgi:type VI secretion system protein VasJ
MKHDQSWAWCFYGKHPVARDYLTFGDDLPMAQAYINWVESGYLPLIGEKEKPGASNSWRFWSRTPNRSQLICGLVRSSCDAIGRTYPLLMIGVGTLRDWDKNWDVLPYSCEKVWHQLEDIATRKYESFERLKLDMNGLQLPDNRWDALRGSLLLNNSEGGEGLKTSSGLDDNTKERLSILLQEREIIMALKPEKAGNLFHLIAEWHQYIKTYSAEIPNAVFLGGSMDKTFMAVFLRPLKPDDFTLLWDLSGLELARE